MLVTGALLGCLLVVVLAVYFASSHPDGLESVAEQQGFAESAQDSATAGSPLADYGEPASGSGLLVGVAGIAITGTVAFAGFFLLSRRRSSAARS